MATKRKMEMEMEMEKITYVTQVKRGETISIEEGVDEGEREGIDGVVLAVVDEALLPVGGVTRVSRAVRVLAPVAVQLGAVSRRSGAKSRTDTYTASCTKKYDQLSGLKHGKQSRTLSDRELSNPSTGAVKSRQETRRITMLLNERAARRETTDMVSRERREKGKKEGRRRREGKPENAGTELGGSSTRPLFWDICACSRATMRPRLCTAFLACKDNTPGSDCGLIFVRRDHICWPRRRLLLRGGCGWHVRCAPTPGCGRRGFASAPFGPQCGTNTGRHS